MVLSGEVVDAFRRPIPFATIWLDRQPWESWAETDKRGLFRHALPQEFVDTLRSGGGPLRLAARAPRHAPSQVMTFDEIPRADLSFVLEPGDARLRLEVIDSNGQPLSGVRVSLAPAPIDSQLLAIGQPNQEWMPTPIATTDDWGLLRLDGLAPGEQELRLSKQGYSPRLGRLNLVKGEICQRVIELRRSAVVQGVLLRADGGPLGRAIVRATSSETLQSFESPVDSGGHFRVDQLPAGTVTLVARSQTNPFDLFEARALRALEPGQTAQWNPVLGPVSLARGRLLDSNGDPLAGWRVELREENRRPRSTETDESGAYELPAPEQSAQVAFFHPDAGRGFPTRVEALGEREELVEVVELDPGEDTVARVVGRVLLPTGQPAGGQTLVLQRRADRIYVPIAIDEGGRFSSPPLPPGLYMPVFPQHGLGWTPDEPLRVEGQGLVDLGTLELPALGRLKLLTSVGARYTQKFNMVLELLRPGVEEGCRLPVMQGMYEVPMEFGLAPGSYELSFPGEGVPGVSFDIESHGTTLTVLTPPK